MEAIVYQEYGSSEVLELKEIDKPGYRDNEILIHVRAASVNPYDWHQMTGLPLLFRLQSGLRGPKEHRLGADLAGQVEEVGSKVSQFRPGDKVFGGVEAGGLAEYVSATENSVAPMPNNLTFEEAAAVPMAGLTALQGLRDKGRIKPGQKVLINGASGGVGTFAVQLAKAFGAEVTGVCSTRNVEMVRSIGADHVIDYLREDFTRGGERFHLILDLVGNHSAWECRKVLRPQGVYAASFGQPDHRWLGPLAQLARMYLLSLFVSQKMLTFVSKTNAADLIFLKELIEAGKVTPVIDRTYPISETTEAMGYLDEGHTRGKVIITV